MESRQERLLDAAIDLLGAEGLRAVTHRAVDARAGLPMGSSSNYFRTRDALLEALVDRVTVRELAVMDRYLTTAPPKTPSDLAGVLGVIAMDQAGSHRLLTVARYALLLEGSRRPELSARLLSTGARVNAYVSAWLQLIGSADPDHDLHVLGNYVVGVVLHQLAVPDPAFDPTDHIEALLESLIPSVHV